MDYKIGDKVIVKGYKTVYRIVRFGLYDNVAIMAPDFSEYLVNKCELERVKDIFKIIVDKYIKN